ncbi:MAG TPA: hypothetical protein VGV59_03530 [Pyrinomonadaceae bacterium]|nr:hypothetical protein [Pyrinomonadaceae bacterium]
MNKKTSITILPVVAALVVLLAGQAVAQQGAPDARQALSTFPDAHVLLYVNSRRWTTEALPRIVPPAELQKIFGEAQKVGFDPKSISYIAIGARFNPENPNPFSIPDVVVVINGDFSADALVSMARIAGQGKYTEETYGTRTLNIFDFNAPKQPSTQKTSADGQNTQQGPPAPGQGSSMPFAIPKVALTALDANTLLLGVTPYVKAAIDARDGGQGRLRAEVLDLATRQPDMLASLIAEVPEALTRQLQTLGGMPKNDELTRLATAIKRIQLALTMNATDFGVHSVVGTDTPEHARALNGMISMGIGALRAAVEKDMADDAKAKNTKDLPINRAVLAAVSRTTNTANGTEIQLSTTVPQTTIAELVRAQTAPKAAPKTGTATRPRAGRSRRRR